MLVGRPIQHGAPPLKRCREQQAQYGQTKKSRDPKRISSHGMTRREGQAPDCNIDFAPKTCKCQGAKFSKWGAITKSQDNGEGEEASPLPRKHLRFGKVPANDFSDSGSDSSTSNIPSSPDAAITTKKELAACTQDAQDAYSNMSPSKDLNRDEALSEVDVTKFKELPSYHWWASSCWLDASLEALYSALNYGDWNGFEILFNEDMNQTPPSLMYYFYLMMRGCRSWPISTFSAKNGPAQELQTLRDGFRTFLYKMKVVEGPEDSYQDGTWSYYVSCMDVPHCIQASGSFLTG